jgi:hypothetical protein ELI_2923
MLTEDKVRNDAAKILGLEGDFAGTGQITTFNQLGFGDHVLKNHKPDGWYLPADPAVAIILETKSEKEDVTHQVWIDELLKNCAVVMTRYRNVIGILWNGRETNVFINGDRISEVSGKTLESKEFYLDLIHDRDLDKNAIYTVTQRINNNLHFKFGMTDLQDRMIFTACALVVQSRDPQALSSVKSAGYDTIHDHISRKLRDAINEDQSRRRNDKLHILVEEYAAVRMSITENQTAIAEFIDDVIEIGDMINSRHWRGEDVMGIFFNEFSRYKKKSDAGQVFTPDHITSLMYRLIGVGQDDHVLDATCGSGAFLVRAMSNMIKEAGGVATEKAKMIKSEQLFGIELYRKVYALACANMLIHKDGKTNLRQMDAQSEEAGAFIRESNITKVLMNPPYERKYGCMKIVTNVLENVPRGTKAAFILPNTKLDKDGGKKLLKNHTLHTIVKLPDKTFNNVSVETAIFIFEAGIAHPGHKKIAGYFIPEDGLETVKNQGRHDINGLWQDFEDYWVAAIENGEDERYGSRILIDPKVQLSYPEPEVPFELNMEDFMKVAMDYRIFETGMDASLLKETIAVNGLYGLESEGIV